MTLSVVTICRNRHAHLARLMEGLLRSDEPATELVIVDMGSQEDPAVVTGGHAQYLQRSGCRVHFVDMAFEKNDLPLAAARNLGAETAMNDRLVFLDVDCIPGRSLVGSYAGSPEEALACGPVRYLRENWSLPDDTLISAVPDGPDRSLSHQSAYHPLRPPPLQAMTDRRYELFWSLSFSLTRRTWDRIGGFDERYKGYGAEDTDFAFQAREKGVPLWWMSTGEAFHQWHPSSQPPIQHLTDIVANANAFYDKWSEWPMSGWLRQFVDLALIRWDASDSHIQLL